MIWLEDDDIRAALSMADAVQVMRAAFRDRAAGTLVSPERTGIDAGRQRLVWTPGGFRDSGEVGLRLYVRGGLADDQVTLLWDGDGHLRAIAHGSYLGQLRTGAIGGLAVDVLARPESETLGVIGLGAQARTQIEAALSVRRIRRIVAFRRNRAALQDETARLERAFGVEVHAAERPQDVVQTADILVLATSSSTSVVSGEALRPGMHVNSLGQTSTARHEIGVDVLEAADELACDVPELYRGEPDFIAQGTPHLDRMQDLAVLVAGGYRRTPEAITVFLSHGLPGTEVALLRAVVERARTLGLGRALR